MDVQVTSPSFYRALMLLGNNGPTPDQHAGSPKRMSLYDLLASPLNNHPAALHAPPSVTPAPVPSAVPPTHRTFASLFGSDQETPYG